MRSIGSHSERTNSSTHLSCPAHSGSVEKSQVTDRPFDIQLLRSAALCRTTPASVSSATAPSSNPSPASTALVWSPCSAGDRGVAGHGRRGRRRRYGAGKRWGRRGLGHPVDLDERPPRDVVRMTRRLSDRQYRGGARPGRAELLLPLGTRFL